MPLPLRGDFLNMPDEERPKKAEEEVGGIWFLGGDELIDLASSDVGSATVLVPSEHVLICRCRRGGKG
jgi:hypothetical protein